MTQYIVVGAGSAGCLLAARLSEDPAVSVLLLEAGPADTRREIHIPAAFGKLFKSEVDWAYHTEPQAELGGRKLFWPRGKMLGGSSSMNAMIWIRGRRSDYERWNAGGAQGWCWKCVEPAFGRLESMAANLRTVNPLSEAFIEACGQTGIPRTADFNGEEQWGAGLYRVTQRGGKRLSAARAFLPREIQTRRPNLRVETGAHATRVVFEGGRAVGVEYVKDGRAVQARAEREVVLSGGAINSPQLLMLSGVGPADQLRRLSIPVVADLPGVGENLQDHLMCGVSHACTRPVSLANAESVGNILKYLVMGSGPLTSNVAEAGAFPRTHPAIQLLFAPAYYIEHGFQKPEGHGYSIGATLLRPASVGRLWLRSADPMAAPAIDPAYLREAADLDQLVDGVKLAREIFGARAFAPYRGAEVLPGPGADLAAFVRERAETLYHPVGTCAIGAVVDCYLSVRGVEGLRVVDASVMPDVPSGNTNAPTLMIAERAAAMIRKAG